MTVAPPVSAPSTAAAPLVERAFEIEPREESYRLTDVRGSVPGFVRGTYYLNGPARFRRGDRAYRHWLDGDGMVRALAFDGAAPRLTSRFVESRKLADERDAGRFLYRAFGTAFPGDRMERGIALASPVNVSVFPFAGRLLAFGEQGLPWELDPETLATRGEHTFGGRLNPVSPFSAHPEFDRASGEMVSFGVSFSATRPALHLYRFDPGGALVARRRVALERPVSVHDFALSRRYAVFHLAPYVLRMEALTAGGSLMDALAWEPRHGSRLLLVDRESGRPAASIPVGRGYCLHLIGAFETGGQLIVDLLELDRPVYDQYELPGLFPEARGARPVRYVVDPERGALAGSIELGYRRMCDFPATDPRRDGTDYGDFWMLGISASERPGPKGFDELVHADWSTGGWTSWRAPAGSLLGGEPVFLPDPGDERAGAVLCQRFDARRRASSFLLFDAFDVAAGPVAELGLRHPTHLGFHACWEPDDRGS